MKEFNWVEKATDKVWLAIIIWVALAGIANLLSTWGIDKGNILGELIVATLQLVGLFLFLKSIFKWVKRKKAKN